MSAPTLAERLLGPAGTSRHYIESKVWGNGGLMIATPGLNRVDLYARPSGSFDGLCSVEGVSVEFRSPHREHGDQPHTVEDFYKFTRFAMVKPTGELHEDADWSALNRDCAQLTPVAVRDHPRLFAVNLDSPAAAYFAMRALAKAQSAAPRFRGLIDCKAATVPSGEALCKDAVASVAGIDIRQIHYVEVKPCADAPSLCIAATYVPGPMDASNRYEITLRIGTDARGFDPPKDFNLTSLAITAGTVIYD